MTNQPSLAVRDVSHAYDGVAVLRAVSLDVSPGEVHCLLGPSGSGKSTLLRLIAGLERLQSGGLHLDGREVSTPSVHVAPERRAVGFVFQDFALFPHLDVRSNVVFGMPRGPAAERRRAADSLLERVGMADFASAMPHTLSGGQQQRVALVRALARRPAVMLLDEPFSGLDARLREDVRATTLEVLRASGVATLMVTHDAQEALAVSQRISVIREGRVLQTGSPDEVYERFASREVAEVFGRVNSLRARVDDGVVVLPWGRVAVADLDEPDLDGRAEDEGAEVDAFVRPESLRLSETAGSGSARAQIVKVVREGILLRIHLALEDDTRLEALEVRRRGGLEPGRIVYVAAEAQDVRCIRSEANTADSAES